jgi:hypothetical protein
VSCCCCTSWHARTVASPRPSGNAVNQVGLTPSMNSRSACGAHVRFRLK